MAGTGASSTTRRIGEPASASSARPSSAPPAAVNSVGRATLRSSQPVAADDVVDSEPSGDLSMTQTQPFTREDLEAATAASDAEADLDARGTLGVSKEAPVGLQNLRLDFRFDTDASDEQVATLLKLTERYCVIYQTLAHPPVMTVSRRAA